MVISINEILNSWAQMGVFSLVLPFILIFAVVFAILEKAKILGENRTIMTIVSLAIGLLSIQFGFVADFFSNIFPKFGIGLSVFLVLIILIGFFYPANESSKLKWVGYLVGIGVVLWAITNWGYWSSIDNFSIGWWLRDNFWPLIILAGIIVLVTAVGGKHTTNDKAIK